MIDTGMSHIGFRCARIDPPADTMSADTLRTSRISARPRVRPAVSSVAAPIAMPNRGTKKIKPISPGRCPIGPRQLAVGDRRVGEEAVDRLEHFEERELA